MRRGMGVLVLQQWTNFGGQREAQHFWKSYSRISHVLICRLNLKFTFDGFSLGITFWIKLEVPVQFFSTIGLSCLDLLSAFFGSFWVEFAMLCRLLWVITESKQTSGTTLLCPSLSCFDLLSAFYGSVAGIGKQNLWCGVVFSESSQEANSCKAFRLLDVSFLWTQHIAYSHTHGFRSGVHLKPLHNSKKTNTVYASLRAKWAFWLVHGCALKPFTAQGLPHSWRHNMASPMAKTGVFKNSFLSTK